MGFRLLENDGRDCPWYKGEGTCATGCWTEPSCQTDEPINGWPETYWFDSKEELLDYLETEEAILDMIVLGLLKETDDPKKHWDDL